MRQTIELVLGVAGGVLIADLVIHALGPGTLTMLLVLLLTLGVTVAAGEALATDLTGQDAGGHAGRADEVALEAVRIGAELLRGVGKADVAVLNRVDQALGLPTPAT